MVLINQMIGKLQFEAIVLSWSVTSNVALEQSNAPYFRILSNVVMHTHCSCDCQFLATRMQTFDAVLQNAVMMCVPLWMIPLSGQSS